MASLLPAFCPLLSVIYIITKTGMKKTTSYIARERWFYNQRIDSFCMHAIYTGVQYIVKCSEYIIQIGVILLMPYLD